MFKILAVLSIVVGALSAKCGGSSCCCGTAEKKPVRFPAIDKLLGLVMALSLAMLALTGFYAALLGHHLTGYLLICHTGCGGAFAGSLALLALFRAEAETGGCKCLLWTLVVGGLGVTLTAVVMMQPWFGTHGQETLVELHRYSSLLAVVGGIGCCGQALRAKSA
jgi:cytochrome b subunit of formate dehydrogenase